MTDDDSRGQDDRSATPPPTEGVRIIGAVEASSTVGQPTVEIPKIEILDDHDPDAVEDGATDAEDTLFPDAIDGGTSTHTPASAPIDRTPSRFGSVPVIRPDMDPPTGAVPEVIPDQPFATPGPVSSPDTSSSGAGSDESFALPHYSEPATGQVPKVVIDSAEDSSAWSTLSAQPRWRDTEHQFDEQPDFAAMIGEQSGPRLGALAGQDDGEDFFDADVDMAAPSSGFAGADDASTLADGEQQPARRPPRARRPAPGAGTGGPSGRGRQPATAAAGRNLPMAIAVGVGLAAVGLLCFKLGAVATTALVSVVLIIAGVEFFTTTLRAGYQPATLLGMVAIVGLAWGPLYKVYAAYPIVLGLAMITGLMWFLFVHPGEGALMNLGVTLVGIMWIGGLGSFATLTLGLGRAAGTKNNDGIGIVLAAVLVSVSYDVGAYFVGKSIGKTPLSKASPNKTQEGLFGGFIIGWLLPLGILAASGLHPIGDSIGRAAAFTIMCALVAPVGDLCESAIKRDLGVKDMGTLLPGHGGVFDRFDALVFVLPMAWFISHLLAIPGF